ncbi:hypothetical protein AVEN_197743-1 [Araneus ventricosus]|uniref:Uncharacterized protein n=1 Tax=Araneus ventricosus TaxID=182803 RepID=A0A4Y2CLC2_ARAVE|nr:hypothetical protein AVEN_197743-1 [Araneus ventricosus]
MQSVYLYHPRTCPLDINLDIHYRPVPIHSGGFLVNRFQFHLIKFDGPFTDRTLPAAPPGKPIPNATAPTPSAPLSKRASRLLFSE